MVIWLKQLGMLHAFCFGLSTITSGRFGFGADFPDKMLCKLCLVLGCLMNLVRAAVVKRELPHRHDLSGILSVSGHGSPKSPSF